MEFLAICATVVPIPLSKVAATSVVPFVITFANADLGATLVILLPIALVATNSIPASIAAYDIAYFLASSLEYT